MTPLLRLSPEERNRLLRWQSGHPRGDPRSLRARIVLRAAEGRNDEEIARELGVHRLTVGRWRRRFRISRLAGLNDTLRVVSAGRVAEEVLQRIIRTTLTSTGRGGGAWSTRALARAHGVSHMTVSRLWAAYGLRPHGIESLPIRADPAQPTGPVDVVGLYLDPPRAALAVTLERSAVGGLTAFPRERGGATFLRRGDLADVDPPWISAPAFRMLEPPGSVPRGGPLHGSPLLRFLANVEARQERGASIRLLTTAPARPGLRAIERWLVRHPRVELQVLPEFGVWQRRIVEELRALGRRSSTSRQFRGRAEVARSLRQFVAGANLDSPPLEWVAGGRESREREAAYRLRYALAVTGRPALKPRNRVIPPMPRSPNTDARIREMARMIVRKYLRVTRGERFTVECWTGTLSEANALVLEALRVGARPLFLYQDEPTYWAAASEVPATYLAQVGEHRRAALERTDALVSFFGPSDRERWHALPRSTMFRLSEYQDALYRAAARAGARTVQMALGRVSAASARMYGVPEEAWREELLDGCLVDPTELRRRGQRVAQLLARRGELEISHPNGTRLRLRSTGRTPVVSDGTVRAPRTASDWELVTLPAGVVSVAVDERFAEGTLRSNVTSSIGLSDTVGELEEGRWTFHSGRLATARYSGGQEFFDQSYARAKEGRDRPASISIGLNERLSQAPLLEDQGSGTVTMHVGRNDYLGGKTAGGWWAWLFLRGADVMIGGARVLRRGRLVP